MSKQFIVKTNVDEKTGKADLGSELVYKDMLESDCIVWVRPLRPQFMYVYFLFLGLGKMTVCDMDDSLEYLEEYNPAYGLRAYAEYNNMYARAADLVTVSTRALQKYYQEKEIENVQIVPNYIDTDFYKKIDPSQSELLRVVLKIRATINTPVIPPPTTASVKPTSTAPMQT